jgi:hypothetical protein
MGAFLKASSAALQEIPAVNGRIEGKSSFILVIVSYIPTLLMYPLQLQLLKDL